MFASLTWQPAAAIPTIRNAMLQLDPTGGTFTSAHLPYLRLCMQASAHAEAFPIIDNVIHSFPSLNSLSIDGKYPCSPHQDSSGYITVNSGLTDAVHHRSVQEYYLLAAMICIGTGHQRWPDALLYLELVLLTPNQNVVSGFMVEAYRKWLILCILVHGKVS
jgi:COP9 signalosome complex subunit 3